MHRGIGNKMTFTGERKARDEREPWVWFGPAMLGLADRRRATLSAMDIWKD